MISGRYIDISAFIVGDALRKILISYYFLELFPHTVTNISVVAEQMCLCNVHNVYQLLCCIHVLFDRLFYIIRLYSSEWIFFNYILFENFLKWLLYVEQKNKVFAVASATLFWKCVHISFIYFYRKVKTIVLISFVLYPHIVPIRCMSFNYYLSIFKNGSKKSCVWPKNFRIFLSVFYLYTIWMPGTLFSLYIRRFFFDIFYVSYRFLCVVSPLTSHPFN